MKRIVCLTLIAAGIAATAAGAGPFRKRAVPRGQSPVAIEYRTHCVSWADPRAPLPGPDNRPLVWVLDGAGDLKGCSKALTYANALAANPVDLEVFPWSHGYRRLLVDQVGTSHAREQGAWLAAAILERKAREPGRRVVVVGHSAGCAVALAAGDALPVNSIDRMVLLAPSVSTAYDIRPSLWSATEGMDVFCSKKDWVALGFVMRVVGTTDNFWSGSAAGRWGFKPKKGNALRDDEAARLRQHFWSEDIAWTGHDGGHHGMHAPEFVRAFLLPLMSGVHK
jgi:pimeloyl-ACP methyl ester carboxylesterase